MKGAVSKVSTYAYFCQKNYNIMLSGGILVDSIISFHSILDIQSADVVGSKRILDILYSPTHKNTKFKAKYINFGICNMSVASSLVVSCCTFRNAWSIENIAVSGDIIAMLVVLIENMFNWLPDIYIINACIAICWPGWTAIDMAIFWRFVASACSCCFADSDDADDVVCCVPFPSFDTVFGDEYSCSIEKPTGAAHLVILSYPSWPARTFKSIGMIDLRKYKVSGVTRDRTHDQNWW